MMLVNSALEYFAAQHSEQYIGCAHCKESHHETAFCSCGKCFFRYIGTKRCVNDAMGTFITCECGKDYIWD